jgi:hypothetical protein
METLTFSTFINADKRKVWDTMLEDKTYREWTKAFMEGSYYDGSWEKGSEIRFLGADEHGKLQGIISRIKENRKYEFVSIEHFGLIKDGIVDTQSDEVKKWAPSFENYTFNSKENGTEVIVEMQVNTEYKEMFEDMWPRALKNLKTLCEKQ